MWFHFVLSSAVKEAVYAASAQHAARQSRSGRGGNGPLRPPTRAQRAGPAAGSYATARTDKGCAEGACSAREGVGAASAVAPLLVTLGGELGGTVPAAVGHDSDPQAARGGAATRGLVIRDGTVPLTPVAGSGEAAVGLIGP